MIAIRVHEFGETSVLRAEQVGDPTPGQGQVLVRLHAIGVNPVETYIRKGIYGPRQFPYTPGSDGAGIIESIGPGVTKWAVGDRVYLSASISGTYAELALCDEASVHLLPANVSFQQGAAIGVPYATAFVALDFRGKAEPGETVLIHGATGGVGVAAVQIAKAMGLTVWGTGGTEQGREMILKQGAHRAFDHTKKGYTDEILAATNGQGVPLIIEMLANVNLATDLTLLSRNGRVVVVGSRGTIEINPRETMRRDADIRGMTLMNTSPSQLKAIHAALVAGLENQTLRPIIGKELPLTQAASAHEQIIDSRAFGKLILKPGV